MTSDLTSNCETLHLVGLAKTFMPNGLYQYITTTDTSQLLQGQIDVLIISFIRIILDKLLGTFYNFQNCSDRSTISKL